MRTIPTGAAAVAFTVSWLALAPPAGADPADPAAADAAAPEGAAGKETPPDAALPGAQDDESVPPRLLRPDDKRRTLRSYGGNLAYNVLGVLTTGNHRPLLVTGLLTAMSYPYDQDVVDLVRRHRHDNFAEIGRFMGGTIAVSGLTVGLFSAGRIARGERFRAATYDVSQAIIVNFAYTFALKFAVRRERPDGSDGLSFPSGHASNAFAGATVIARHYPRLAIPGYAVAGYIAVSRLAADKHHLSDVVAGAGFGFGVGRAVVRRNGRPPDPPKTKAVALTILPYAGPAGDGRGLSVSLAF